jgi:DNA-directed RNA polymerase specialized sigma24 family protein
VLRHAAWLVRYESGDDLAQGLWLRLLEREHGFRYEGREPMLKWAFAVARSFLADRRAYWGALKRRSAHVLRLTGAGGTASPGAAPEPAGTVTGPSTRASRREQLALAVRVLAVLPARDRKLVRWATEGVGADEQARRLELTPAALRKARERALERFREAYALAARRR